MVVRKNNGRKPPKTKSVPARCDKRFCAIRDIIFVQKLYYTPLCAAPASVRCLADHFSKSHRLLHKRCDSRLRRRSIRAFAAADSSEAISVRQITGKPCDKNPKFVMTKEHSCFCSPLFFTILRIRVSKAPSENVSCHFDLKIGKTTFAFLKIILFRYQSGFF